MESELTRPSIRKTVLEELLKSAKAKMGEVREENERLKKLLKQIMMDYQALEKQFSFMAQSNQKADERNQEHELVSLTLGGTWSSNEKNDDNTCKIKKVSNDKLNKRKVDVGLGLGLDCKFKHKYPMASEESKEKTSCREEDHEESLDRPQVKKPRVCVRSRFDAPMIHDGCQWRKYGQKIAKGNPCPRAYFRCSVTPNCPVRKQVQRCPQDTSILITTYQGTHNHALPLSATTMASATSSAAAMLKTCSLTSQLGSTTTTSSSFGLHSSNLTTTFNNNNPSSMISTSYNSHPTITLDFTTKDCLNYGTMFPFNNSNYNNNTMNNIHQNPSNSQNSLSDKIVAVTSKAIVSNPNFHSALAAGMSSYVGNKTNNEPK